MLIYMIRHGRTDWNDERRIMGREQVPLNDEGREMVEAVAGHLAGEGIAAVYTGTLARARETAEILAGTWGVELIDEPRLDESAYEKWVGRSYSDLKGDPDFDLYGTRPSASNFSSGEGMSGIQERALAAVARIAGETRGALSRNGPRPDAQARRGERVGHTARSRLSRSAEDQVHEPDALEVEDGPARPAKLWCSYGLRRSSRKGRLIRCSFISA